MQHATSYRSSAIIVDYSANFKLYQNNENCEYFTSVSSFFIQQTLQLTYFPVS